MAGPGERHRLVAEALLERTRRALPATTPNAYVVRYLAEHVAEAGTWSGLAAAPEVLDELDPQAVASVALRTAFGRADLPEAISATLAGRHLLAAVPARDRALVRAITAIRHAGGAPSRTARRGCVWRLVWARLRRDPWQVVLAGHSAGVTALASVPLPDGRVLLAAGCADGRIRLWDPSSGDPVGMPLTGHRREIRALAAMSVAGATLLVSASVDALVAWNPTSGGRRDLAADRARATLVTTVAAPDGGTAIVTAGEDQTVRFWHPIDGGPYPGLNPTRFAVGMSIVGLVGLDGRAVAVVIGPDHAINLYDTFTGTAVCAPLKGHTDRVECVATIPQPSSRQLASAGRDLTARVWNLHTAAEAVAPFVGHARPVTATTVVPSGDGLPLLATGAADSTARLWTLADGGSVALLTGHTAALTAMCAVELPDGRTLLATGGADRTVRLWNPKPDPALSAAPTESVMAMTVVPGADGTPRLATSGVTADSVQLWNPVDGWPGARHLLGRTGIAAMITALPDAEGRPLFATAGSQSVRIWNAATGDPVATLPAASSARLTALTALPMPAGPAYLATGGERGTVGLWDLTAIRPTYRRLNGHEGAVRHLVAATPARRGVLVSGGDDGTMRIWNPLTGLPDSPVITLGRPPTALTTLTTPDGRCVIAAAVGASIRFWDAATARELSAADVDDVAVQPSTGRAPHPGPDIAGHRAGIRHGHEGPVRSIALMRLPGGRVIAATGGDDQVLQLIDVGSGRSLSRLPIGMQIHCLVLLGRRIMVGGALGLLALDVDPQSVQSLLTER
ncbi:WD40 repeat domain-containing protein [Catellatospora chokoriensis]|uniref:WD40 repeat protein n=1 Tax=Catellatospora chokoriensis TaxID=310353 RepID=A0A8J3KC38_9ACTN|nr:WD40 repeat domain-containing protein [Catellatospora chokoriensis]GIF93229.1 hypothetical protein Cch02nite_66730 [Catellatospora chokoriensis]